MKFKWFQKCLLTAYQRLKEPNSVESGDFQEFKRILWELRNNYIKAEAKNGNASYR